MKQYKTNLIIKWGDGTEAVVNRRRGGFEYSQIREGYAYGWSSHIASVKEYAERNGGVLVRVPNENYKPTEDEPWALFRQILSGF